MRVKRHSLFVFGVLLGLGSSPTRAQLTPPAAGGLVELDQLLQQLGESRRVLVVGAHPDDEDTALLALMTRGYGARAAYLSLSRGEGGQNLIGPELGPALGLLRTRELLAARATDGAEQYFTRAFDFGYTRSPVETAARWPPDSILKDVVRIVRRFRPHVIVSVFSGTARDGHGQHQAAGVAAHAAYDAAGDAARFPELAAEEGLEPWTPLKLYRSTRFDDAATTLRLATGHLDPRHGRSFHQIAMASRSLHRSQDMGREQPIGPREARLRQVSDRTGVGHAGALFDGIPPDTTPLARTVWEARRALDATDPGRLTRGLAAARATAAPAKRVLLDRAIAASAGVVVDALVADAELIPGQTVDATLAIYNAGRDTVVLTGASWDTPAGWTVTYADDPGARLAPESLVRVAATITVPSTAPISEPYFLRRPPIGFLYDWSEAPPAVRGTALQPPPVHGVFAVTIAGAEVTLRREATFRTRNQAAGEVRREVRVVPRLELHLAPRALVWPTSGAATQTFTVAVTHRGATPYAGRVGLTIDGWDPPPEQLISMARPDEVRRLAFGVRRPREISDAAVTVTARAIGEDGAVYWAGVNLVDYPHVRATTWVEPATARVRVAPMQLPAVRRVGYVRGAADRVPEALTQIGLPLEVLSAEALAQGDLSRFDAIVVGSRAYETDSTLTAHNERLLAFAAGGGTLIVQYQQYQFVQGGFAPFPLTIGRPHDRVTDETAPVRVLDRGHALLTSPNSIGPADWDGWPQERGLYFAQTWDDAYRPVLETHDPGRPPLRGGMLIAPLGAGVYVYTGLSFFRALPAGTPGAFRVFLNLLNLTAADVR